MNEMLHVVAMDWDGTHFAVGHKIDEVWRLDRTLCGKRASLVLEDFDGPTCGHCRNVVTLAEDKVRRN